MGRFVSLLKRHGLRKGLYGANGRWMAVWAVVATGQFVRKRTARKAVVERFTLKPGESLLITDLGVPESEAGSLRP